MSDIRTNVMLEAAGLTGAMAAGLLTERTLRAQRQRLATYEHLSVQFPVDLAAEAMVHTLGDLLAPLRRSRGALVFDVVIAGLPWRSAVLGCKWPL